MSKTLVQVIEDRIKKIDSEIAIEKENLDDDYMYYFTWGKCETLYKHSGIRRTLLNTLTFISENPDKTVEYLEHHVKTISKNILDGHFLGTSTNLYSNLSYTYDKEIGCEIVKIYQEFLYCIKNESLEIL